MTWIPALILLSLWLLAIVLLVRQKPPHPLIGRRIQFNGEGPWHFITDVDEAGTTLTYDSDYAAIYRSRLREAFWNESQKRMIEAQAVLMRRAMKEARRWSGRSRIQTDKAIWPKA